MESIDVFDALSMLAGNRDADIENLFYTRPSSLVCLMRQIE